MAKRGANEVSSSLLDFVKANVDQGAKEFSGQTIVLGKIVLSTST